MPKVRVLMPTYNSSLWIKKTLGSLLGQTFSDFDVLCIDDASTDDTADLIRSFQDKRITLIVHETNMRGNPEIPTANLQLYCGDAQYIKVLHHDDFLYPDCLKHQVEAMEKYPQVGLVSSKFRILVNGQPTSMCRQAYPAGLHLDPKKLLRDLILRGQLFGGPSQNLIRCVAIKDFHRGLRIPFLTEAVWWGCIFAAGYGFYLDERVLATYNIHQGMNTLNYHKKFDIYGGYLKLLQRYGDQCGLKDNFLTRTRIRLMRIKPEIGYRVTKLILKVKSINGR